MVTKEITLRLEESIHLKLHKYVKHPDNSVKIMLKNGSYGRQLMRLLPFSSSTYGASGTSAWTVMQVLKYSHGKHTWSPACLIFSSHSITDSSPRMVHSSGI